MPFALFAYGEQHVSSVLAGVLNATTPLTTLVFLIALVPQERATGRRLLGLLLGFLGVICVLGVWDGLAGVTLIGGLACLGATTGYGAGFAYTRRFFSGRGGSAAVLSAVQISCVTLELALVTPLVSGLPTWTGTPAASALVLLGAIGTGYAFLLNLHIVRAAGPTIASTVTYVMPLWSTALGAVLLAEPVGWNTFVGGILVVAGVLVTRARPRPAPNSDHRMRQETQVSLADVRQQIDQLDDQIVVLLARRQQQVKRASADKQDEAAVRAPDRRKLMMERLASRAVEEGVDPDVVARVYAAMIDAFIDVELREHHRGL